MYTYRVTLTLIVVQFLFNSIGFSIDRVYSNSPLNIGPQYPFMMLRTMFEPDTGWISKAGEVMVEYSFRNMNTYVMSSNSTQSSSYGGDPSVFTGSGSGYSVYFDGELLWSNIHLKMGIEDDFEIQFTHRSVRFLSGALDDMVENFHNTFGLTNQGREHTEQDKFGIYVWDNAKQEMVYQLSHPGEELKDQSTTVGLKLPLTKKSDLNTALSLKYNIYQTEFDNPDSETDLSSGDFDQLSKSINLSLNSSASHQELTLHSAISLTLFDQPIVERGPNRVFYLFGGANLQLDEGYQLVFQNLIYSSVFPDDENSDIGWLIDELTIGARFFLSPQAILELAMVENLSQGPHNIDIVFLSTIGMVF